MMLCCETGLINLPDTDKDLLYMSLQTSIVQVYVADDVYELIGEISTDESSNDDVVSDYEMESYLTSMVLDPQGMARTKQTQRGSKSMSGSRVSPGGLPLATSGTRRSPRFLDSDSLLDAAYSLFGVGMGSPKKSNPKKSPKKKPSQTGFSSSDDADPGTSQSDSQRSTRSTRSNPRGELYQELIDDHKRRVKLAVKLLRKKKAPRKALRLRVRGWNSDARVGLNKETAQGWLKKTVRKRDEQNRVLRRARPGTKALQEIRFYQWCQTFLMATIPFQRLVREICDNDKL